MSSPVSAKAKESGLPVVGVVFFAIVLLMLAYNLAVSRTGGTLVYALDDAYIHLSMARNFHANHVWGISPTTPASATSSPLWTFALSIFDFLPVDPILGPLFLNLILAGVFAVLLYRHATFLSPLSRSIAAILLLFGLPGATIFLSGMENLLHAVLTVIFVAMLLDVRRESFNAREAGLFAIVGFLMMLTRYESAFLFLVPALWGVYRRQFILLMPMVGAIVGVLLYGILSTRAGLPFIPGTLLLKSDLSTAQGTGWLSSIFIRARDNLIKAPTFAAVAITGTVALLCQWKSAPHLRLAALSVLVALLLHISFSYTRQLFRYEVYLVAAIAYVVVQGFRIPPASNQLRLASAGLLGIALVYRGAMSMIQGPEAVQNINDQQYQMARFLTQFYPGGTIALNDIGVVSFYSDVRIVDLYGLSNNEVLDMKRAGTYNTSAIENILTKNNIDAGIVFYNWYDKYGGLPDTHVLPLAGQWIMQEPNIVCAWDGVAFVAPPAKARFLQNSMARFQKLLPSTVKVEYFDLKKQ